MTKRFEYICATCREPVWEWGRSNGEYVNREWLHINLESNCTKVVPAFDPHALISRRARFANFLTRFTKTYQPLDRTMR